MKSHAFLIKQALLVNYFVSVWDGEEWAVNNSSDEAEILDHAEGCEMSTVVVTDSNKIRKASASVMLDGDEKYTIIDYVEDYPFFEKVIDLWEEIYD